MKSAKNLKQKKEDYKIYDNSYNSNNWYLIVECFQYHKRGHISTNFLGNKEKKRSTFDALNSKPIASENSNLKGKAQKINCFSQKIISKG